MSPTTLIELNAPIDENGADDGVALPQMSLCSRLELLRCFESVGSVGSVELV